MKKKGFICLVLLLSFVILSGCETTKGTAQGAGNTLTSMFKGAETDASNFWQWILKADDWIKTNLW